MTTAIVVASMAGRRVTPERRRSGPTRRRALAAWGLALMTASLLFLFVEVMRARSFASQRHRRAQEIEARELELYRRLADGAAVLESQRRIYMERFRKLEARIQQNDEDITALRARLATAGVGP
jgi:type II secretory pathway component PulM